MFGAEIGAMFGIVASVQQQERMNSAAAEAKALADHAHAMLEGIPLRLKHSCEYCGSMFFDVRCDSCGAPRKGTNQ